MVKLHNKDTLTAPIYIALLLYRGDVFRMALSRIGEIRSIIPPECPCDGIDSNSNTHHQSRSVEKVEHAGL